MTQADDYFLLLESVLFCKLSVRADEVDTRFEIEYSRYQSYTTTSILP